jgi:molybdopterin-containing oxidoreductase family membrane subunit
MVLLMVIGELTALYSPARDGAMFMLTGRYAWLFWTFLVGTGIFVPLVILFHPTAKKNTRGVIVASALIVAGIFVKRFYLVIPGAAYPLHLYPGKIEGAWGATGSFFFGPTEIVLAIGIVGFLALMFLFGLKYLELLPAKEEAPKPVEQAAQENKPASEVTKANV